MLSPEQQATWKRVRPVLLTSLVPVVAALGFFGLATYGKKTPSIADRPSMAAFDACLTANNVQPQQHYQSQFDATIASQQEMKVCGSKIPASVIRSWQKQAEGSRSSFQECMQNMAGSGGRRGFGRFRGGPSGDFRNAYVICRSLLQGSGEGGSSPPPKSPAKPVAPIA
jgi:hypothetical protein